MKTTQQMILRAKARGRKHFSENRVAFPKNWNWEKLHGAYVDGFSEASEEAKAKREASK